MSGMKESMNSFMAQMSTFMESMQGLTGKGALPRLQPAQPAANPNPQPQTQPQPQVASSTRPILPIELVMTPARPIPSGFLPGFNVPRVQSTSNLSRSEEDFDSNMSNIFSPEDTERLRTLIIWCRGFIPLMMLW